MSIYLPKKAKLATPAPQRAGVQLLVVGTTLALASLDFVFQRNYFGKEIRERIHYLMDYPVLGRAGGLFIGNTGIGLVLIVLGSRYREREWVIRGKKLLSAFTESVARDADFYFGGAGILFAQSTASHILGDDEIMKSASNIAHHLRGEMQTNNNIKCWKNSGRLAGEGLPYLGAAHGAAGTAFALATFASLKEDRSLGCERQGVFEKLITDGRTESGKQICDQINSRKSDDPAHLWCRGLTGVLWCFLNTGLPPNEKNKEIEWCFEQLKGSPAVGNTTYCHGLAARLDVLRMLGSFADFREESRVECLHSLQALQFMSLRKDGLTCWSSESSSIIAPELWTGFMGTAVSCALALSPYRNPLLSVDFLYRLATQKPIISERG